MVEENGRESHFLEISKILDATFKRHVTVMKDYLLRRQKLEKKVKKLKKLTAEQKSKLEAVDKELKAVDKELKRLKKENKTLRKKLEKKW